MEKRVVSDQNLVGRTQDLLTLHAWRDSDDRLLTLCGPPGVGKSSLGRVFVLDVKADGGAVVILNLQAVHDADELCAEVAREMGVPLPPSADSDDALPRALDAAGPCLLWLDGLRGGAKGVGPVIQDWLDACPDLRVLVTSQERLRLPMERVQSVAPLATPRRGEASPESPAIALWIDRVRRVSPGYAPDTTELEVIADIVRRVDGLPLAIELAAGRMELLDARRIRQRLSDRFSVLSRPTSNAASTLRTALEWAWSHLSPVESSALAQCSIFVGGFDVEAAEAVLSLEEPGAASVLDTLQALRDKSLLRSSRSPSDGRRRLSLYHSVRQLAIEKLRTDGAFLATATRHAEHFAAIAKGLGGQDGWSPEAALRRLAPERDNLVAVARRWLDDDEGARFARAGAECTIALETVVLAHGPHDRQHVLLDRAVERVEELPAATRAEFLRVCANARRRAGRLTEATADCHAALLILQAGDSVPGLEGRILRDLSVALGEGGLLADALEALERALRVTGRGAVRAPLLVRMGDLLHDTGDLERATTCLTEAIDLCREEVDTIGELTALVNLGNVLGSRGSDVEASARFERVRATATETGHEYLAAYADMGAGLVAHDQGRHAAAREAYELARQRLSAVGAIRDEGMCRGYIAWLDFTQGYPARSVTTAERALRGLDASGNIRYSALVRARLAVAEAALGWEDAASGDTERALARIDRPRDPCLGAAIALHAAHTELLLSAGADGLLQARREWDATRPLASRSTEVRLARRALEHAIQTRAPGGPTPATRDEGILQVGPEARWFAFGGARVDLGRRGAQRRVLHRLVRARRTESREPLSVYELFEAGWPGQSIGPEHSANRVYNALFELRKRGLRRAIIRHDDGYFLDPGLELEEMD